MSRFFKNPDEEEVQQYIRKAQAGLVGQNPKDQTLARSSNPYLREQGERNMAERENANERNQYALARDQERAARDAERAQKEQARAAQDAADLAAKDEENRRKIEVRAHAAQGGKTETDILTGKRSIATHADGARAFEPAPIGEPVIAGTMVPTVEQDGKRYPLPDTAPGVPIMKQPVMDDRGKQSFVDVPTKTDKKTGDVTVSVQNPQTGLQEKKSVGYDANAAYQAKRKADIEERARKTDYDKTLIEGQRIRLDPTLKPAEDELKAAQKDFDDLDWQVVPRGSGFVRVNKNGAMKPAQIGDHSYYKESLQRRQERLDRAKAAYAPLAEQDAMVKQREQEIALRKQEDEEEKAELEAGLPQGYRHLVQGLMPAPSTPAQEATATPAAQDSAEQPTQAELVAGYQPSSFKRDAIADAQAKAGKTSEAYNIIDSPYDAKTLGGIAEMPDVTKSVIDYDYDGKPLQIVTLQRGGKDFATVGQAGDSPAVFLGNSETEGGMGFDPAAFEAVRALAAKPGSLPIYNSSSTRQPISQKQEADWVVSIATALEGEEDVERTDAQTSKLLKDLGAQPQQITEKFRTGEISLQTAENLMQQIYSTSMTVTDNPASDEAFQKWVAAKTKAMDEKAVDSYGRPSGKDRNSPAEQLKEATEDVGYSFTKQNDLRKDFLADFYLENRGKPAVRRADMLALHQQDAADKHAWWSHANLTSKAGAVGRALRDDVAGSMLGMATGYMQAASIPYIYGVAAAVGADDDMLGRMADQMEELNTMHNRDFGSFTNTADRNIKAWLTQSGREAGTRFDRAMKSFQSAIDAAEEAPDSESAKNQVAEAEKNARAAALAMHELAPDEEWRTTSDDLDPNKDPALGKMLAMYKATADPRMFEAYKSRMLEGNGRRQYAAKLDKIVGQNSTGFLKAFASAQYAGWQELGAELVADVFTLGVGKAASVAAKVATKAGKVGLASRIGNATATALNFYDKVGEFKGTLQKPLTATQKASNTAVTAVKGMNAEGFEEVIVEVGAENPELLHAYGMGMVGVMGLMPAQIAASAMSQEGVSENIEAKNNAKVAEAYNTKNANTPGFTPITPEQAGMVRALTPQGRGERLKQLAEEHVSAPQAGESQLQYAKRKAKVEAELQIMAMQDELSVEAAREIDQIPIAERPFASGIAKVAVGKINMLTQNERKAIQSRKTESGADYFATITTPNGATYETVTAEGRLDFQERYPAIGELLQTDESQILQQQANPQNNGQNLQGQQTSQAPASTPVPVQPLPAGQAQAGGNAPSGGAGTTPAGSTSAPAASAAAPQAQAPNVAFAGMDLAIYENARAAGKPVSPSMANYVDNTPDPDAVAAPAARTPEQRQASMALLSQSDGYSRDWTQEEIDDINVEMGDTSPFSQAASQQVVADQIAKGAVIDDSIVSASGVTMPADYQKTGRKWTKKGAAATRGAYTPQQYAIAKKMAEKLKAKASKALPGAVIIIDERTNNYPSGGLMMDSGRIHLLVADMAAEIARRKNLNKDSFEASWLATIITHEAGHLAQHDAAKREMEEQGITGDVTDYMIEKYDRLYESYEQMPHLIERGKQIYDDGKPLDQAGQSTFDQFPKWIQAVEIERALLELIITKQSKDNKIVSELFRAQQLNLPFVKNLMKVLQEMQKWLQDLIDTTADTEAKQAAKDSLNNVVNAYQDLVAGVPSANPNAQPATTNGQQTSQNEPQVAANETNTSNPAAPESDNTSVNEQQEASQEAAPEPPAKPKRQFSPKKSRAVEIFELDPFIISLRDHGGVMSVAGFIRAKGKKAFLTNKSMWDGVKTVLRGPQFHAIWSRSDNGFSPDAAAQALYDDGKLDSPTPDALWDRIAKSMVSAQRTAAAERTAAGREAQDEAFAREKYDGQYQIELEKLQENDIVTIGGEEMTVAKIVRSNKTGEITRVDLQDGTRFGLQSVAGSDEVLFVENYDDGDPGTSPEEAEAQEAYEAFLGELEDQPVARTINQVASEFGEGADLPTKLRVIAPAMAKLTDGQRKSINAAIDAESSRLRDGKISAVDWQRRNPDALTPEAATMQLFLDSHTPATIREGMARVLAGNPQINGNRATAKANAQAAFDKAPAKGKRDIASRVAMDEGLDGEAMADFVANALAEAPAPAQPKPKVLSDTKPKVEAKQDEAAPATTEATTIELTEAEKLTAKAFTGLFSAPTAPAASDGFYSQLEQAIAAKMPKAAPVAQVIAIAKDNAKVEEIKWSGIVQEAERLAMGNNGKVPKDKLIEFLQNEGRVKFEEVISSENQFSQYTLPGGENYREVVLAMPSQELQMRIKLDGNPKKFTAANEDGDIVARFETKTEADQFVKDQKSSYTSSHFPDVRSYVAHMRTNERDGGLFIEEVQSDRHQEGRKKGYVEKDEKKVYVAKQNPEKTYWEVRDSAGAFITNVLPWDISENTAEAAQAEAARRVGSGERSVSETHSRIADAPYRTTWPLALFKRALRDAVASRKDWIGWTTGETQNDRFDLSKQVDQITVLEHAYEQGTYTVTARRKGEEVINKSAKSQLELADLIGKDLATKAVADIEVVKKNPVPKYAVTLAGQDLKVGGSGMKGFYDNMLPKEIGKYVKQWGGKVVKSQVRTDGPRYAIIGDQNGLATTARNMTEAKEAVAKSKDKWPNENFTIEERGTPIWRIDITPAMKQGVAKGQMLFSSPTAPTFTENIPADRLPSMIGAASALIAEGVRTPAAMAKALTRIEEANGKPSGLRRYSESFWSAFRVVDNSLEKDVDWSKVYAEKEEPAPAAQPAKPAPTSKMDVKNADSKELFADDGGFALATQETKDGDIEAKRKAEAEAAREAADKAQGKLFSDQTTGNAKQSEEQREIEMVVKARQIALNPDYSNDLKHEEIVRLHDETPAFTQKTSTSKINQAYSTPMPMAFSASLMMDMPSRASVLDAAAGHGGLLIAAPKSAKIIANELDPKRHDRLKGTFPSWDISNDDGTTFKSPTKVDGLILNPPFGSIELENGTKKQFPTPYGDTTQIDHAIVAHNLTNNFAENGRAVLIIGGPPPLVSSEKARSEYYGKGSRAKFFEWLHDNYQVVDHITADGSLYKKQGAGYPVDIIVINGKGKSKTALPSSIAPVMVKSWSDLYDRTKLSENERIQQRTITEEQVRENVRNLANELDGLKISMGRGSEGNARPPSVPSSEQVGDSRGDRGVRSGNNDNVSDRPSSDAGTAQGDTRANRDSDRADGRSDIQTGSDSRGDGERDLRQNSFQSSYVPVSKGDGIITLDTLIPTNMADPVRLAMEKIQSEVGDLTAFVSKKLGYAKGEKISEHYAGEQIDALAAAIYNIERNGALIVGDQTGIGKGRIAAGLMRYAVNQGFVPVFVTEKPGLLDSMYRTDIPDVGGSAIIKPAVMLGDLKAWPEGKAAKLPFGKKYFADAAKTGTLAKGANAIFTTYSQIMADTDRSESAELRAAARRSGYAPKSSWRTAALESIGKKALYILDESHNASGASTTGYRMAEILKFSDMAYYSSATSAKRPENFAIYFKTNLGKVTGGDMGKLTELLQSGGVPAMQLASYMLAKDGQYLRRERSFEGITFKTHIVEESAERDAALADNLTYALRQIVLVQERMAEVASIVNDRVSKMGKQNKIQSKMNDKLETMNFASKTHNVVSQYLLAIKVKASIQESLKALESGKKVVVGLSNTMESAIEDLANQGGADFTLDYKGLVMRYLDKMRTIKVGGEETQITATPNPKFASAKTDWLFSQAVSKEGDSIAIDPEIVAEITRRYMWDIYEQAQKEVRSVDLGDLPLSPIDVMRQEIEKAGYRTGEITGRSMGLDANGETYVRSQKEVDESKIRSRDAFNDEDLDFLVINQSGSTGINLHAGAKVKNKKPRMMIVVQPSLDITTFMQMLGRIHRSGQVVLPEFMLLQTSLPAEFRPAAVLAVKMGMLNANTTSNSKSEISEGNKAVDVFNKYGDQIAYSVLERDPDLIRQLLPFGGFFKKIDNGNNTIIPFQEATGLVEGQADGYVSRSITGYLAILPVEEQNIFWEKVFDEYTSLIDYLNEMGQNDLVAKDLDLKAKTIESKVFTDTGDSSSAFDEPSYIETVETALGKPPIKGDEAVKLSKELKAQAPQMAAEYQGKANQLLEKRLKEAQAKAIKWTAEKESKMRGDMIEARNTITRSILMLGDMGSIRREDKSSGLAVVEFAKLDEDNLLTPSKQVFSLQVNDGRRKIKISASKLGEAFTPGFSSASEWDSTTYVGSTRHIATGNLFAALAKLEGKGQVISYTTASGATKVGLMLPAGMTQIMEAEAARTRPITSAAELAEALSRNAKVQNATGSVSFDLDGVGNIVVKVPASKSAGGKYWGNAKLNALIKGGEMTQRGEKMAGGIEPANVQAVMEQIGEPLVSIDRAKSDASVGTVLRSAPTQPPTQPTTPNAISTQLAKMPPIYRDVYLDLQAGMSPADVAVKYGKTPTAIANIMRRTESFLSSVGMAAKGQLEPSRNDEGLIDGGRPDLSLSGIPAVAAVDQMRKAAGVPEVRSHDVVNAEAAANLKANYDGVYDRMLNLAREGKQMTDLEVAQTKLIIAEETMAGNIDSEADRIKLAMLIHGYREIGTETARALAMRRDPHQSPAARAAQYIAEAMFSPDPKTRAAMRKNPKNAEQILGAWLKNVDRINNQLLMQGIDIKATLAAFREDQLEQKAAEEENAQMAEILADEIKKLNKVEKPIIEMMRTGAKISQMHQVTGTSIEDIRAIIKKFNENFNGAMNRFGDAYMQRALMMAPSYSVIDDVRARLGIYTVEELDDTVPGYVDRISEKKKERRQRSAKAKKPAAKSVPIDPSLGQGELKATWKEGENRAQEELFKGKIDERTGEWNDERDFMGQGDLFRGQIDERTGTFDLNDPLAVNNVLRAFSIARGTKGDKMFEWYRMALLSGPQTAVKNLTSAIIQTSYEQIPRRALEAAVNNALSLVGLGSAEKATIAEFVPIVRNLGKAFELAAINGLRSWEMEANTFESYANATPIQLNFGQVAGQNAAPVIGGKVGQVMRSLSYRHMTAADEYMKSVNGQLEAAAQSHRMAKAEGLSGVAYDSRFTELMIPGSAAWVKANDFAHSALMQKALDGESEQFLPRTIDQTALLLFKAQKLPMIGKLFLFAVPFVKFPTNSLKKVIETSPLGTFVSLIDGSRALRRKFFAKKLTQEQADLHAKELYNKARLVDDVTNQTVGWMLYFALKALLSGEDDPEKLPFITGTVPYKVTSRGERDNAEQVMPAMTIRIGNAQFSYGWSDPIGSSVASMVDLVSITKRKGWTGDAFSEWLSRSKDVVKDKSYMQGISNLINAAEDPDRFADRIVANTVTGFVPNLIRQPMRETDSVVRNANPDADAGFFEAVATRVGYGIYPYAAPAKIDAWGNEIERDRGEITGIDPADMAIHIFDPTNAQINPHIDPIDRWIFKYNQETADSKNRINIEPIDQKIEITIPGESRPRMVAITNEERKAATIEAGQNARLLLGDKWDETPRTTENAQLIIETVREAQKEARAVLKEKKMLEILDKSNP